MQIDAHKSPAAGGTNIILAGGVFSLFVIPSLFIILFCTIGLSLEKTTLIFFKSNFLSLIIFL